MRDCLRKAGPAALLAVGLLSGGLAPGQAPATKGPVADADLPAWVDARVRERQPGPEDRRFDEIGWAADLRTARRLAKEHNRPVFLFTHDGRMNVGRC